MKMSLAEFQEYYRLRQLITPERAAEIAAAVQELIARRERIWAESLGGDDGGELEGPFDGDRRVALRRERRQDSRGLA